MRAWISLRELVAYFTTGYIVMNGLGPLLRRTGLMRREATVRVDGEPWRQVESLRDFGPDHPVCRVHPSSGAVEFGDGVHGRAPTGSIEISSRYRYGAGAVGAVAGLIGVCGLWTLSIWVRWRRWRRSGRLARSG